MRSIRMRLCTVGGPMNAPTDNSKPVPLKWFVFIIKYLVITCGRMISVHTKLACFETKFVEYFGAEGGNLTFALSVFVGADIIRPRATTSFRLFPQERHTHA